MRKKLPEHKEIRVRYPFSLKRRIINGHMVWLECYKLTEYYDSNFNRWYFQSRQLDDRSKFASKKDEAKMFMGPY